MTIGLLKERLTTLIAVAVTGEIDGRNSSTRNARADPSEGMRETCVRWHVQQVLISEK